MIEGKIMQTIHATEAAEAAININRADWIHGAAELVLANEMQYDRSTPKSKEAFISLDNVMEDAMGSFAVKGLLIKWMGGAECCDCRDALTSVVRNDIKLLLYVKADDFNIGVE